MLQNTKLLANCNVTITLNPLAESAKELGVLTISTNMFFNSNNLHVKCLLTAYTMQNDNKKTNLQRIINEDV